MYVTINLMITISFRHFFFDNHDNDDDDDDTPIHNRDRKRREHVCRLHG